MDEKELQELKARLADAEQRASNLEKQNLEIRAANKAAADAVESLQEQIKESRALPGVTKAIAADVKRRMELGLPLHHAIQAAESQAENDARIAAEEKAAAKAKKKGEN